MATTIPGLLSELMMPTNSSSQSAPTKISPAPAPTSKTSGKVEAYLNKIYESPKFKSLDKEGQEKVKGALYDKIVQPWYLKSGAKNLQYPSKEQWIKGGAKTPTSFDEKPQLFESTREPGKADFTAMAAVTKGGAELVKGGSDIAKLFSRIIDPIGTVSGLNKNRDAGFDKLKEKAAGVEELSNWYLGKHFSNALGNKLAVFGGEQFGQLPAYIVAEGVSNVIPKGLEKTYPLIYKGLRNAAVGYVSSLMLGKSQGEAAESGAAFAAFAPLESAASKAYKASRSFIGRVLGLGGVPALQGVLESADARVTSYLREGLKQGEAPLSTDPIAKAGINVLDAHSDKLFGKEYAALSRKNKLKVVESVVGVAKEVAPNVAAYNKDLLTSTVKNEIAEAAKVSDTFMKNIKLGEQFGLKPVEDNVEAATTIADVKVGRGAAAINKVVNTIARGSTTQAEKQKAGVNKLLELSGLGPGAASTKEFDLQETMLAVVKNNYKIEDKEHQLVQLWGIRNEVDKIYPGAKSVIKHMMEMKFPPSKGFTPKDYNIKVENLEKHFGYVATMVREGTPGGVKHGARIFGSTNLDGNPTRWQKMGEDEAEAARLELKLKQHPEAKAAVKKVRKSIQEVSEE